MSTASSKFDQIVRRLAALHGVQTEYVNASGARVVASVESLRSILEGLGARCRTASEAAASERRALSELQTRWLAPVLAAWERRKNAAPILIGEGSKGGPVRWELALEDGSVLTGSANTASLPGKSVKGISGVVQRFAMLPLPAGMPRGYHTLTVRCAGRTAEAMVVCAPSKSFRHPPGACDREWGVFAPVYSLQSKASLGIGDLSDLHSLAEWGGSLGGKAFDPFHQRDAGTGHRHLCDSEPRAHSPNGQGGGLHLRHDPQPRGHVADALSAGGREGVSAA